MSSSKLRGGRVERERANASRMSSSLLWRGAAASTSAPAGGGAAAPAPAGGGAAASTSAPAGGGTATPAPAGGGGAPTLTPIGERQTCDLGIMMVEEKKQKVKQ